MQPSDSTIAAALASFAHRQFLSGELPVQQAETAAQRVLDNLGCMLFGLEVPPARRMAELALGLGRGDCPVVGMAQTGSPTAAALSQGILAQSFELNDLGAYVHAGACVVPAALAALAAGARPASGAQFIIAVALGYEVTVRLAEAIGPGAELHIGWHTPGFHGAVGAAVTAALLLGSDADTVARSIAIAADLAGGGLMVARLGSDTKRAHCGRGAETGVLSALLAREGLQCRLDALENETWGYCRAMAGGQAPADLGALTRDLGHEWVGFDRTAVKYHCVGAEVLGVIDNVTAVKRCERLDPDGIESVTVGTPRFFVLAQSHRFPTSPTEVHFSVEYAVAMALLFDIVPIYEADHGQLHRWMTGYRLPQVQALAARVRHEVDAELEALNPYSVDSRLRIRLRDGREFHQESRYVRQARSKAAMQFAPMDARRIRRKFAVLTHAALTPAACEAFADTVLGLPALVDARALLALGPGR
jgi:aconitate decarboxylase